MKAICLPRRNRSSFWAFCSSRLTFFLNWEFLMTLFRAEAVFASNISKFGKSFPQTDREDFNSSKKSTISTSLIHNIASNGKSEQVVTWFLKRIFLCCPTIEFCGKSTSVAELVVNGFVANVGIGIVPWISLSSLVWIVFVIPASGTASRFLCTSSDWIKRRKLISKKRFPVIQIDSMYQMSSVCRGWPKNENSESSQVDWKRETTFHYNLISHPEHISRITRRIHLFFHLQLGNELLYCLVISLNFCTETSSFRCSCAHLISPISYIFRIWVFRRTFSFRDNSSCSRTCSRLDSTNPYWASCSANFCSSVCRRSSPMHLLRDSTWSCCFAGSDLAWLSKWSLLPSRRDPLAFDGLAFLNTELLIMFPCSDEKQCTPLLRSFLTFRWMRPQTALSIRSRGLCTYLSLLHDHRIGFLRSFLDVQWWSQHFL